MHSLFWIFPLGELLPQSLESFNPATDLAWATLQWICRQPTPDLHSLEEVQVRPVWSGSDIILGRTGLQLYPVAAIPSFIASRGTQQRPFFLNSTNGFITKAWFIFQIRDVLRAIGLP